MSIDKNKFQPVGNNSTDRSWPEKGHDLHEGDFIEGVYVAKNTNLGPNNSNMYILQTSAGERVGVWGSTVLDTKFEKIAINQRVAVEYVGTKKGKSGSTYKDYFVGVDPFVPDIQMNADVVPF